MLHKKPYDDLVPGKCQSRRDTQYLQESSLKSQFTLSATALLMLDLCKTQQIETFMIGLCFMHYKETLKVYTKTRIQKHFCNEEHTAYHAITFPRD